VQEIFPGEIFWSWRLIDLSKANEK